MHDAATFAEHLLKQLRDDKTAIEKSLAAGSVADWSIYQNLTGTYKGLAIMENSIIQLLSNMQKADL
jgi:hypothetical protein